MWKTAMEMNVEVFLLSWLNFQSGFVFSSIKARKTTEASDRLAGTNEL
jgi:hypothetical protein